jgi:hypothetical protein
MLRQVTYIPECRSQNVEELFGNQTNSMQMQMQMQISPILNFNNSINLFIGGMEKSVCGFIMDQDGWNDNYENLPIWRNLPSC